MSTLSLVAAIIALVGITFWAIAYQIEQRHQDQ